MHQTISATGNPSATQDNPSQISSPSSADSKPAQLKSASEIGDPQMNQKPDW